MATIKPASKESKFGVVEGVFCYLKIAQPDFKYQSEELEYSLAVIVDEDRADEWNEQFVKQPAKKVRAGDFENKYKIELPERFKGHKNVYEIKLKRSADNEDFRPKVLLDTADERIDITTSRLVANGSSGKVSYYISSNSFGTFARLQDILIDEANFIEYKSTGKGVGSVFGEVKPVRKEEDNENATRARRPRGEATEDVELPSEKKERLAEKAPTKAAKKAVVEDIDEMDDAPF